MSDLKQSESAVSLDSKTSLKSGSSVKSKTNQVIGAGRAAWYSNEGKKDACLLSIAGGSFAGKTALCRKITEELRVPWIIHVSLERFYKPLTPEQRQAALLGEYNWEVPEAYDFDLLKSTLQDLKARRRVVLPVFDTETMTRHKTGKVVYGGDVVLFEGPLALHWPELRDLMDMKIFVATEDDVRLATRLRSLAGSGMDHLAVLKYYHEYAKPAHEEIVEPTRKWADLVLPRGVDNDVAVRFIQGSVASQLQAQGFLTRQELANFSDSTASQPPNVLQLPLTPQIKALHTIFRDKEAPRDEFIFYTTRLSRLLIEYALSALPFTDRVVTTPDGHSYTGRVWTDTPVGVSVMRAGETMEPALREVIQNVGLGKLLIQTDPASGEPQLYYYSLPRDISSRRVLLMDPVIGSGASAMMAIQVLLDHGVQEDHIIFLTMIVSPSSVHVLNHYFPQVRVVVSEIDDHVDENFFLHPGIGNYGNRWFGTDDDDETYITFGSRPTSAVSAGRRASMGSPIGSASITWSRVDSPLSTGDGR